MSKLFTLRRKYIDDLKNVEINGYIGFYCYHCFEPIYKYVNYNLSHEDKESEKDIINLSYSVECDRCKYISIWDDYLDPNITKAISILNLKGYKTRCCCEGHNHGYGSSDAYILFENMDLSNMIYEYNLKHGCAFVFHLSPWYLEDTQYINMDNEYIKASSIRCSEKVPLHVRIKTLNRWAKELPFYKNIAL